MKLIFAVLDVSLTMGLTRCYKTEGFFTFIFAVFVHFHAISIRYTRLRMRKSICIPNFDEIPQSTAEIKLLGIRMMDGRHIGILLQISIFTYSLCVIIRMSIMLRPPAKFHRLI